MLWLSIINVESLVDGAKLTVSKFSPIAASVGYSTNNPLYNKLLFRIINSLQIVYFVILMIKYLNFSRLQGGRNERGDRNDDLRHGF